MSTEWDEVATLNRVAMCDSFGSRKARQKALNRVVALKILPPGVGKGPAFAERFTLEAKTLAPVEPARCLHALRVRRGRRAVLLPHGVLGWDDGAM